MNKLQLWIMLIASIILLVWLIKRQKYSSTVRDTYEELEGLAHRTRRGRSTVNDIKRWERSLTRLGKYPKELNKLDDDIKLREAFVIYLERHYPTDERLEPLREVNTSLQQEALWSMAMKRNDAKMNNVKKVEEVYIDE